MSSSADLRQLPSQYVPECPGCESGVGARGGSGRTPMAVHGAHRSLASGALAVAAYT